MIAGWKATTALTTRFTRCTRGDASELNETVCANKSLPFNKLSHSYFLILRPIEFQSIGMSNGLESIKSKAKTCPETQI